MPIVATVQLGKVTAVWGLARIRLPDGSTRQIQVGDIVHWDNQATLHARTAFDANERRVLKRVSLAGARPF